MNTPSDRVTFKEFLKMLRPDLRPSLASKELHKFLCWYFGEAQRHTNPRTNGMLLEKINTLPISELIPGIENEIEVRVLEWELHFKKNGFAEHNRGIIAETLAKYPEWRSAETSRRRAHAARIKAVKGAAAKAEDERTKNAKKIARKLARQTKPHISKGSNVAFKNEDGETEEFIQQVMDGESFQQWQEKKDTESGAEETESNG